MTSVKSRLERIQLILCTLLVLPLLSHASDGQKPTLEQVGYEIAMVMQERDESAFIAMLDFPGLAERIAFTVADTEKEREEYVRGLLQGTNPSRFSKAVFAHLKQREDISAKFMRVVDRGREQRLLVRLDMGDLGFDYLEFVTETDATGVEKIVDWFPLSSGELLSVSVGGLSRLLIDPAPGLLKSMFGLKTVDPETVRRLRRISDLRARGELKEAYLELEKLPPEISTSRIILTQRAALAGAFGDEEGYRAMLEQLAARYSDQPGTAFMLIDHYMYQQDYARCLESIGHVEKRVGQDGMTYMLRANIHVLSKNWDEAVRNAREGMRIEPDFSGSYFTLIETLIAQEQFEEAIETLETLQSDFGYVFSREVLEAEPSYAKFVASPAFKRWQQ